MDAVTLPSELDRLVAIGHPDFQSLRDLRHVPKGFAGERWLREEPAKLLRNLPVAKELKQILRLTEKHGTCVVTAPPGSGKTIAIPLAFLAKGYKCVVAGPRIVGARAGAMFTSKLVNKPFGDLVGYCTSLEGRWSNATQLTHVTYGLQLEREVHGNAGKREVIFIDEAHERTLPGDLLIAWMRRERLRNPDLMVVVMSATIDAQFFSDFLGGAPIVSVAGRNHAIERVQPKGSILEDIEYWVAQGKNCLVFLPGKREIDQVRAELEERKVVAEILPLHGDLSAEEQQRCFKDYDIPKVILSTSIGQTSITVPGIDVVIDSGLTRRSQVVNGVQQLVTVWISRAESEQRAGRCGRLKAGIVSDHHRDPMHKRQPYAQPEIARLQLENYVLRLLCAGIRPEKLEMLDPPPPGNLQDAYRSLRKLGMIDTDDQPTELGRRAAQLPISVNLSRMLDEAGRFGAMEQASYAAVLLELDGITEPGTRDWVQYCPDDTKSDLCSQVALLRWGLDLLGRGEREFLSEAGLSLKSLDKAALMHADLKARLEENGWWSPKRTSGQGGREGERGLVRAFAAGFPDCFFVRIKDGYHRLGDAKRGMRSQLLKGEPQYIVGLPFDINLETDTSHTMKRLVLWPSEVPLSMVPDSLRQFERAQRSKKRPEVKRRAPQGRMRRGR